MCYAKLFLHFLSKLKVGDGYLDHNFWGRPEDMTMARPAQAITATSPGSELAAETAAAMAASSILFKTANPGKKIFLLNYFKYIKVCNLKTVLLRI